MEYCDKGKFAVFEPLCDEGPQAVAKGEAMNICMLTPAFVSHYLETLLCEGVIV
jgi:hypothetical protein